MDLIKFFFKLQLDLKMYHWVTLSYPRHVASGTLHDSLITLIDKFMEVYQGKYNRVSSKDFSITVTNYSDDYIINVLQEAANILHSLDNGSEILESSIQPHDTDLLNIRDEMLASINQTIYLFKLR